MKIHQTPTPPAVCGPFRYSTGGWLIFFVWRMKKKRKVLSRSFATMTIDWIFIAWLSHLVRWQAVERVHWREASLTRPEEKKTHNLHVWRRRYSAAVFTLQLYFYACLLAQCEMQSRLWEVSQVRFPKGLFSAHMNIWLVSYCFI